MLHKKKTIVAIDLFCGAGGLTRGLLDAGIKVKKGYDIDSKLKKTYEKNNGIAKFYSKDISKVTGSELLEGIDKKNNYFLLAGCAPCQPFSRINKKNFNTDGRKFLLMQFGRLIKETKPDYIFLENVPGLKTGKGKYIFEQFINILEKYNYNYNSKVLNVKNYGVPQSRSRLILLASRHNSVQIPEPTHGNKNSGKKPYITVKNIISKYPIIRAGTKHKQIPNHHTRNLMPINKKRMKCIQKDGGSRLNLPKELWLECHKKHNGHTDVYGRMRWNAVAPTLTCKCTSISNGRFGHPTQLRGISVREAAALQTFKDNYIFYGSLTETTKAVGNAVPVKFSKVFGNYFIEHMGEK